jgi:chaperonin GroES
MPLRFPMAVNDRVLIRLDKDQEQEYSLGGIALPDSAKDRRVKTGRVLCMGQGILMANGQREAAHFGVSDQVYFDAYAGNKIKWQGEELHLVPQADILAVVPKDGL